MEQAITFYLNGEKVVIRDPSPSLLLIDYLRSPGVGLAGAKKGCGQGGCGACTVILAQWNAAENRYEQQSINSCLRPVCSLEGMLVFTIEGTGGRVERLPPAYLKHLPIFSRGGGMFHDHVSPTVLEARKVAAGERSEEQQRGKQLLARKASGGGAAIGEADRYKVNPVAQRLAENNGTQCGYCTTGFVMNMSSFLSNHPHATQQEIEDALDGNLCRCTGYRPILTGMKTFASDWTPCDEQERMKCLMEDPYPRVPDDARVYLPYNDEGKAPLAPVHIEQSGQTWEVPQSLDELAALYRQYAGKRIYILHSNTGFGIYPDEFRDAEVLVNISLIEELKSWQARPGGLLVGAATTYTTFIERLQQLLADGSWSDSHSALASLLLMARRTAGTIVRNAATLAGNSMLVLKHMTQSGVEPFPSDLFTVLCALDTRIRYFDMDSAASPVVSAGELVQQCLQDPGKAARILLLDYQIPLGTQNDIVFSQKVALREVNSHTIVNCTSRFDRDDREQLTHVVLTFGGIAPYPWRASQTEALILREGIVFSKMHSYLDCLSQEVDAELKKWHGRMQGLPSEGFTDAYRQALAEGFLYKLIVNALLEINPQSVPENVRSCGRTSWGHWGVSRGIQQFEIQDFKKPVSQPYVKLMAIYQSMGQVRYTHEIELPPKGLNAAFAVSRRALANYYFVLPEQGGQAEVSAETLQAYLRDRFAVELYLIGYQDIPAGGINMQGMGADQPLFAVDQVSYVGQAIALVVTANEQQAISIAQYVSDNCVAYTPVDYGDDWPVFWNLPITTLDDAIEHGSVFPDIPASASYVTHIWKIQRPGSRMGWVENREATDKTIRQRQVPVDGIACTVVESSLTAGDQIHFYMETQSCVALPTEANRMIMHPSSQSPMEMHQTTAMALGVEYNQVEVAIKQLGGGYGGKTEQARFITGPTAVAAKKLNRPVRLVMPREEDSGMIGKRHAYYGQYQIAIDQGQASAEDKGIIRGIHNTMWGDGGAFYDCSFIVSNCMQTRSDCAYHVNNFVNTLDVCRTNKAPNTAFRSFGAIQMTLNIENAIDDAATAIGMSAEDVREKNLYQRGQVTPFGQALTYCYMSDVWQYARQVSRFDQRKAEVAAFNKANRWRKRGIAMVPVKYGSGYNLLQLEQATAVVSIYANDGSVIVNQGGVEMGQGAWTVSQQVASYILNIPMDMVHIEMVKTSVIPNPTSSGASTGTPYNAEATKAACEQLRQRLTEFAYQMRDQYGDEWCQEKTIAFWNYPEKGWATEITDSHGTTTLIWQHLVALAFSMRVNLVAQFNAPIKGGEDYFPALTYKPYEDQPKIPGIPLADPRTASIKAEVGQFSGFTYSAACAVVEIDVLTGESKILSSDLVYDAGWSLNPAIDVGQVEGAFVQGVGYVTTEKLVFEQEGEEQGRLNSVNTWRYKPPATTSIPLEMNVYLFPRNLASDVPENENTLFSAKEIGEPPLVLASCVFFAIKSAIRASRVERGLDPLFRLNAPATVQEIRDALQLDLQQQ